MAALAIKDTGDARVLELSGRLDALSIRGVWDDARRALKEASGRRIVVDAANVDYCDGAGIALIVDILRQRKRGDVEVMNLKPAFAALLNQFDVEVLDHDLDPEPKRGSSVEEIGEIASGVGHDMFEQVSFVGETMAALAYAVRHPSTVRWKDVWLICEKVGADALPIVALISFLLGVILAFQSAIPMKKFGAEIFVADLIGLAMLRELGPLMTAILLAGRSGAAFAACRRRPALRLSSILQRGRSFRASSCSLSLTASSRSSISSWISSLLSRPLSSPAEPIITVEGLTAGYGDFILLENVTFDVR